MNITNKLRFAALASMLMLQTSITRADDSARDHRNATVTWTKWVTEWLANDDPAGVFAIFGGPAGGDIGVGTLAGEAFKPTEALPGGAVTFIAAYHFTGSKHSLTVTFVVTQQAPNADGVIVGAVEGVVTEGWLKGNRVTGSYASNECDAEVKDNLSVCFNGTAEIKRGSKNTD